MKNKNILNFVYKSLLILTFSICLNGCNSLKKDVEFRVSEGAIQWHYVDDDNWNKLVNLSDLNGKDGQDGLNGKDGKDGLNGKNGKDGKDGKDGLNGKDGKDGLNGKNGKDGLNGKDGKDGRNIELKSENNKLYWKYTDETEWVELYEFLPSSGNKDDNPTIIEENEISCLKNKTICNPGTLIPVKVNDSTTLDFYVVKDDNTNLTLIAAKNVGSDSLNTVQWYNSVSGNTNYGPVSVLTYLGSITESWTNISLIEQYSYDNTGTGYKRLSIANGVVTIIDNENNISSITNVLLRARLLTYEEAKNLGCTSSENSCPTWLVSNLKQEQHTLTPYGYWLLSSGASGKVYNIRYNRLISTNSSADNTGRGIRPVITIKK